MEDLNGSILIDLIFDPALKPELVGGKRAFACDGCVAWHHKNIHFLVPPHMKTLQDLAEVIKKDHGIQTNIILSTKGSVLPLDFPCKVLTRITGPIDVLPVRPFVKVVVPKCTCAAASAEAFERMICQLGDANMEEVWTPLTESSSSSTETAEKSGTLKRAAGVSRLDEITMNERDGGVESSESSSTSEGIELGNTSDEAPMPMNATDDQQSTPSAVDSNSDGPRVTSDSSVCTLGSKVYDADKESTEKSTEYMEASGVSGMSSHEKENPEEIGEEPNTNETFNILNQGQVTSAEPTGSSWTNVTSSSSSKDQCEQLDEKQNEAQADTRSANLDDSSENTSGDADVETNAASSIGLQGGARAETIEETMEDDEESIENLMSESFDMFDDSAESTKASRAKRHRLSTLLDESGRVLKKLMMTDPAKDSFYRTLLRSNFLRSMTQNLDSVALFGEILPMTSTPNSTMDFSAAYGGGEGETSDASGSEIEQTGDSEMEISTELVTED